MSALFVSLDLHQVIVTSSESPEDPEVRMVMEEILQEITNQDAIPNGPENANVEVPIPADGQDDDVKIIYVKKEAMEENAFCVKQLLDDLVHAVEYLEDVRNTVSMLDTSEDISTSSDDDDDAPTLSKRPRLVSTSSEDSEGFVNRPWSPTSSLATIFAPMVAPMVQPALRSPVIWLNGTTRTEAPSMTKHRDSELMYQWCLEVHEYIYTELEDFEIRELKENPRECGKLIRRYQKANWLADGGPHEGLPVFAAIMEPLTRATYLEGLRDDEIPTANLVHRQIFKSSQVSDVATSDLLKMSIAGKIDSKKLKMGLELIQDRVGNWREILEKERMILGSIMVKAVEDVPDGGFLACFEEMPDIATIQTKRLTCLVMMPSTEALRVIAIHGQPVAHSCISPAAYGGSLGTVPYLCFGPSVEKTPSSKTRPTSVTVAAAFNFSMGLNKNVRFERQIYTVAEFF